MKLRNMAIGLAVLSTGLWNEPSIQAASRYSLVVVHSSDNVGTGVVTVDRAVLHAYGGVGPADCSGEVCGASYPAGTRVTLRATPAAGSVFMGWGGECTGTSPTCTVRMGGHRDVLVYFGK